MLNTLLTIIFILVLVCLWVAIYDGSRFIVVYHRIRDRRIRGSFRAVVLADLHNKRYGKDNKLLLEAIDAQHPDAILIAGDMLTAKPGKSLEPAVGFLSALAEKYPIFYGNGNHEQRLKLYPETYGDMGERYAEELRKLQIEPLVNTHTELKEHNITIYGAEIDRYYYRRLIIPKMDPQYLPETLGEPDREKYTILLAHNPDFFPNYAAWGADMVFAGHVHGGMVRIPGWRGIVSPNLRLFPKYDGGVFREKNSTMILSRGLGMHTIPLRLFNPAEVIVVDFGMTDDL